MSSKAEFLGSLPLFKDLDEEQLEELATIAPEYEFEAKSVIAYQRDIANSLYIVRSGRLFARQVDEHGRVRESRAYTPRDYFQDKWLITQAPHPATVRATEPGRLIIIDGPSFIELLDDRPDIVEALEPWYNDEDEFIGGLSDEAWEELTKSRIADDSFESGAAALLPDEFVEYVTHRSRWILLLNVIFRFVLLVGWLVAYALISASAPFLLTPWAAVFFLFIPVAFLAFWIFYSYLDWRNDYLMITNKQVLHYEFSLAPRTFGTRVQKTPIDQIQSVTITQPNLLSNLLNVGTARITTAAQTSGGVIRFDYISKPQEVREVLERLRRRVAELDAGHEQALMRRTLERHFNVAQPYEAVQDEEVEPYEKEPGLLSRLLAPFATRIEEDGEVTYRKSRIFLLLKLKWALLLFVGLIVGSYILVVTGAGAVLWIVWGVLAIIDLLWIGWDVEDWRNDQYRVNDRYVVDIDRKPLGFGETRRQAELNNIQNVNASKAGLLATIFRYGDVLIETAGSSADINFERVAYPNLVQQDIFTRREKLMRQQQEAATAQRRKEYALLLDVYQQIREQGQVPRRTPQIELEDESDYGATGDYST